MLNTISIGSDHAGFEYKQSIISFLQTKKYIIKDFGTYSMDSVDYPDFAHPVSSSVVQKEYSFGILICGSGNGVAITANKYNGIRAAICWNEELSILARQHNDANILCIPARFVSIEMALRIVTLFLETPFEQGRHKKRVEKINKNNTFL
ncbi:MAG: ribose 5-phosphate isomerase B [Chitinophagaceae bacterium]|nr:ribose 5-phosphate isomerase B [Chitinophagaceae bacterium]